MLALNACVRRTYQAVCVPTDPGVVGTSIYTCSTVTFPRTRRPSASGWRIVRVGARRSRHNWQHLSPNLNSVMQRSTTIRTTRRGPAWPPAQAMVDGRCCGFNVASSQSERMSAEMRALCGEHGLTLYDPAGESGVAPQWISRRSDEAQVVATRVDRVVAPDLPLSTGIHVPLRAFCAGERRGQIGDDPAVVSAVLSPPRRRRMVLGSHLRSRVHVWPGGGGRVRIRRHDDARITDRGGHRSASG